MVTVYNLKSYFIFPTGALKDEIIKNTVEFRLAFFNNDYVL